MRNYSASLEYKERVHMVHLQWSATASINLTSNYPADNLVICQEALSAKRAKLVN